MGTALANCQKEQAEYEADTAYFEQQEAKKSKLESLVSNPSDNQELVMSGEGWKSVANWRKLTTRI